MSKCVYCSKSIPEGTNMCRACNNRYMKLGMTLQSLSASQDDVEKAYEEMEGIYDIGESNRAEE